MGAAGALAVTSRLPCLSYEEAEEGVFPYDAPRRLFDAASGLEAPTPSLFGRIWQFGRQLSRKLRRGWH